MTAGRPTKYTEEMCKQAYKLCLLGSTNEQLADFFEVVTSTIDLWISEKSEFSGAIKRGRLLADAEIAESLYHRAKGYRHEEDKIFCYEGSVIVEPTIKHYPPDTGAAALWLKNRRPIDWRDKREIEHAGPDGGPIQTDNKWTVEFINATPKTEQET